MRGLSQYPVICLDFDGTVVAHRYPEIGPSIGAERWLQEWSEAGAKLILWTMRDGPTLEAAVRWYEEREIPLFGVQINPEQADWTGSPKPYAKLYIDDHGFGIPLVRPPGQRPYVDWWTLGPRVLAMLTGAESAA